MRESPRPPEKRQLRFVTDRVCQAPFRLRPRRTACPPWPSRPALSSGLARRGGEGRGSALGLPAFGPRACACSRGEGVGVGVCAPLSGPGQGKGQRRRLPRKARAGGGRWARPRGLRPRKGPSWAAHGQARGGQSCATRAPASGPGEGCRVGVADARIPIVCVRARSCVPGEPIVDLFQSFASDDPGPHRLGRRWACDRRTVGS